MQLSKKFAWGWVRLVTFLTMWLMAFLFSVVVTSSGLLYALVVVVMGEPYVAGLVETCRK